MSSLDDGAVRNRWSWDEPPPLDDGAGGSVGARTVLESGPNRRRHLPPPLRRRTSMRRSALGHPRGDWTAGEAWRPTRGPRSCAGLWVAVAVAIAAAVVTVLAVHASHDHSVERVGHHIVLRPAAAANHTGAGSFARPQESVQPWDKSDNSA